jgi:hypothetical protein
MKSALLPVFDPDVIGPAVIIQVQVIHPVILSIDSAFEIS